MADSVVSSIVNLAVDNLSRLLIDEVNLLSGVKDDITSLSNDLRFMAAFLKNSEGKRSNELVREMVNQIREVAFQSEDTIDMYVVNVARHKSLNKLRRCFHSVGHVSMLHEVNAQVKAIKSTLEGIYKNIAIYGIDEMDFKSSGATEGAGVEYVHRRRRDVEEKEVLREPDPNLNVVSIIGMGGLGKTTLAKKVYNKDELKNMFDCCAWSYVSNDYIIRDLLLSLLKCLKPSIVECKDLSVEELKDKLSECLKGKKYLVVLDDIWKTQVWDELKGAFPDDRNGSRIIITSRLREVALYSRASFVYDLPFLDEEVSWKSSPRRSLEIKSVHLI
ncbi:hypothetical protein PIB30_075755 [Stylosanthes scabra]|uniref:Uncharacterized protein n=1 Tax=Stylosanthes scabra TaxID=79078 RepID=A0ABU6XND9_9FABA|nr:hypothetical protein [Stylosanthes scabra]